MNSFLEGIGSRLHHELVRDQFSKKPILWHYTDAQGLLGILERKSLRLTNARYLNDESELSRGVEALQKECQKALLRDPEARWASALQRMLELCSEDLVPGQDSDVFLACFSAESDDLSQWRGYSGGEGGFSIGFDFAHFFGEKSARDDSWRLWLLPCIYGEAEVAKLAYFVVNEIVSASAYPWFNGPEFAENVFSHLRWAGVAPKNMAFQAENEWRIAAFAQATDTIEFRSTPTLKPYINYLLSRTAQLPVSKIMVGPQRHPDLAVRALRKLLDQSEQGHVEVQRSSIPFRAL